MTSRLNFPRSPKLVNICRWAHSSTVRSSQLDAKGRISFNLMQHHRSQASAIRFYAFDILTFSGRNMLQESLLKRRNALTEALWPIRKASSVVDVSQTVAASGADMIHAATAIGLEGVVAKRKDSFYESGKRSGAWVKYKINKGQVVVARR